MIEQRRCGSCENYLQDSPSPDQETCQPANQQTQSPGFGHSGIHHVVQAVVLLISALSSNLFDGGEGESEMNAQNPPL